jgi:hypothetical protein
LFDEVLAIIPVAEAQDGFENGILVGSRVCRRWEIGNNRREWACVAVMACDGMQNGVGLLLTDRQPRPDARLI